MRWYNHRQEIPSTSWVIAHNLGTVSTVSDAIIPAGGETMAKILPLSVIHTDNNTLTITFSIPETGQVRIFGN